jgi:hypothetical protein
MRSRGTAPPTEGKMNQSVDLLKHRREEIHKAKSGEKVMEMERGHSALIRMEGARWHLYN